MVKIRNIDLQINLPYNNTTIYYKNGVFKKFTSYLVGYSNNNNINKLINRIRMRFLIMSINVFHR